MQLHCSFSSFVIKIIAADHIKTTGLIGRNMPIIHNPATSYEGNAIINFRRQFVLERGLNNLRY